MLHSQTFNNNSGRTTQFQKCWVKVSWEKSFSQHFALTPGLSPFGWGWKWIKDQVSEMGSLSYTSSLRNFIKIWFSMRRSVFFFREPQDICLILWMAILMKNSLRAVDIYHYICTCTSTRIACYTNILHTVMHRNNDIYSFGHSVNSSLHPASLCGLLWLLLLGEIWLLNNQHWPLA